MPKWKLVLVGMVVLLAAGAVVPWSRPSRITRENFDRIRAGMNRHEVEAILGPPGDYTTGPTGENPHWLEFPIGFFGEPYVGFFWDANDANQSTWACDEWNVYVAYSASDQTISAAFVNSGKEIQGRLENLFWRAKRQWRRWFP